MISRTIYYVSAVLLLCVLLAAGCSTDKKKKTAAMIGGDMLDAYKSADELYTYVWTPEMFREKQNEKKIEGLLDRLIVDFHNVEKRAPVEAFEPGFRIALAAQQNTLSDVRKRFSAGQKDYANWRLRGLSRNCIACHSRFGSSKSILGSPPRVRADSIEGRLAAAEFLVASRQFDKGSDALYKLGSDLLLSRSGSYDAFEALKLWLVVEVRVKRRSEYSIERLNSLLESRDIPLGKAELLREWIADLKRPRVETQSSNDKNIAAARKLLAPVINEQTIEEKESHLVATLNASAVLHDALEGMLSKEKKKEATYLLAVAYDNMPIQSLDVFAPMYLEQCIREFPATKEAQLAFRRLKLRTEVEGTGSGGTHLDSNQKSALQELKQLAFGEQGASMSDAGSKYLN